MEKDTRRIGRLVRDKKIFVVVAGVTSAMLFAGGESPDSSQGHEPYLYSPIPKENFREVLLENEVNRVKESSKFNNYEIIFSRPEGVNKVKQEDTESLTKGEKLLSKYKQEEVKILEELKKAPKSNYNKRIIADIKMYYPIYKAIADHYKIDWVSIMVTHQGESTGSRSKRAFNGQSAPYYGAGQRNVDLWPQSTVKKAFKEVFAHIPEVADIPTRQKSDAAELAFVGNYLNRNYDASIKKGKTKYQALYNSFRLYTASNSLAETRVSLVKKVNSYINPS